MVAHDLGTLQTRAHRGDDRNERAQALWPMPQRSNSARNERWHDCIRADALRDAFVDLLQ